MVRNIVYQPPFVKPFVDARAAFMARGGRGRIALDDRSTP
jgi:hypothetical protein